MKDMIKILRMVGFQNCKNVKGIFFLILLNTHVHVFIIMVVIGVGIIQGLFLFFSLCMLNLVKT